MEHDHEFKKLPTGIEGFDEITEGGIPEGRTTLVMGGPGSGKTIFALQSLVNAAERWQEPGIFIAFEENSKQLFQNTTSLGWNLAKLTKSQSRRSPLLFFIDAHLSPDTTKAGTFDLTSILSILQAKAKEIRARRIVFDGIDVLLSLLDDPSAEKREIYRLHHWLVAEKLTGIITAKTESSASVIPPRYGFMQFMVDCLVVLYHRFEEQASLRRLSVIKYRGSGSSANEYPFAIGPSGIEVTSPGRVELEHKIYDERLTTGIDRLDNMLGGGIYRGTSVLVSGAPGTGKTTLSGAFAEASCRRGEKALFISFDEANAEIVRNLSSVNIRLRRYIESGYLAIRSFRTEAKSADEHLLRMEELIRGHKPQSLLVDPVSALMKVGGERSAVPIVQRLIQISKSQGITMISTTLLEDHDPFIEHTPLQISTIADTWIHLSYAILGGERNRALTIIKSRGTRHSNQVRELLLSNRGVTLSDVYTAEGQVLMGTARWQKEAAEETERLRIESELQRKRLEMKSSEAEIRRGIETLRRELEAKRAEFNLLTLQQQVADNTRKDRQRELRTFRNGGRDLREDSKKDRRPREMNGHRPKSRNRKRPTT